jgi:hypothetical protein
MSTSCSRTNVGVRVEQEVSQMFIGKGLAGFIQKPYKLSVFKDAIRGITTLC